MIKRCGGAILIEVSLYLPSQDLFQNLKLSIQLVEHFAVFQHILTFLHLPAINCFFTYNMFVRVFFFFSNMEIGLSNGPGPPENPVNPTRPDRFWAGLRIFGLGFGSYFQVIFGFESASSHLYILV